MNCVSEQKTTLTEKELYQYKGLWHGVHFKNVMNIFNKGFLEARTTQRYWEGGHHFFDDEKDYQNSFFLKGWSTTRNKFYAMAWGDVVFLIDYEKIKQDFKIQPIAWNSTIRAAYDFKKETEEFIISNQMNRSFEDIKEDYYKIIDDFYDVDDMDGLNNFETNVCSNDGFIGYLKRVGDKKIDVSKYIKGFIISNKDPISCDLLIKELEHLTKNPLFFGFFDKDKARSTSHKTERKNPKWR